MRSRMKHIGPASALLLLAVSIAPAQHANVGVVPQGFPPHSAKEDIHPPGLTPEDLPPDALFVPPQITASAPVVPHGPLFFLAAGEQKFGPYLLDEGAHVGSSAHPYAVTRVENGTFFLKALSDLKLHGPFPLINGAEIELGQSRLTLSIQPPTLFGRVDHPRLMTRNIPVKVVLVTPQVLRSLMGLRSEFAQLQQERATKTQPVTYRMPTQIGPNGMNRSPVVNRSERDIQRAEQWASQGAYKSLDRFLSGHQARTIYPDSNMRFTFTAEEKGVYLVCVSTTVTPRTRTQGVLSEPIIWWAHAKLIEGSVEIVLGPDNTIPWDQLFAQP